MNFFSFGKKHHKEDAVLIFDIGSASVGGALVVYTEGEKPLFIYGTRSEMPIEEELDVDRLRFFMRKALDAVAQELAQKGVSRLRARGLPSTPTHAYCVLGSPWYALQARMAEIKEKEPFTVREKHIEALVEKEAEGFRNDEEVRELIGDAETTELERAAISIKLNGYNTSAPEGKTARTLQAHIVLSVAPKHITDNIAEEVQRTFPLEKEHITFHSFPLCAFDVIRSMHSEEPHFIAVDVSGEVTDVVLVREDRIKKTASFPAGKRSILRKLAKDLQISPDEARSLLRSAKDGTLDKQNPKNFQKQVQESAQEWLGAFERLLANLSKDWKIPHTVFLTADKDLEPFFKHLIEQEQFNQFTLTDSSFSVQPLRDQYLHRALRYEKTNAQNEKEIERDIFLMVEAVFVGKMMNTPA